jgi:hypothetical protein
VDDMERSKTLSLEAVNSDSSAVASRYTDCAIQARRKVDDFFF